MERGAWQATVNGVAESGTTEQLTHIMNFGEELPEYQSWGNAVLWKSG